MTFSSKIVNFQKTSEGCRAVSVGRSPIRFFDLILNNALSLRASHYERKLSVATKRNFAKIW